MKILIQLILGITIGLSFAFFVHSIGWGGYYAGYFVALFYVAETMLIGYILNN